MGHVPVEAVAAVTIVVLICARSVRACDQVVRNRIDHDREHNRDRGRRFLGSPPRHGSEQGDDIHLAIDQFACECRESIILAFRESRDFLKLFNTLC